MINALAEELQYFFEKFETGFWQVEDLYDSCFPKCHNKKRASVLYKYAKLAPNNIVELGSYAGSSTVVLAEGSGRGNWNKVYSIDPHKRYKTKGGYLYPNSEALYNLNVMKGYHWALIRTVPKTEENAFKTWNKKIGLLFVDVDMADMQKAAEKWLKFVEVGGYIICLRKLNLIGMARVETSFGFKVYKKVF